MLDIRLLREQPELIEKSLKKRGQKIDVKKILELDKKRVAAAQARDEIRHKQRSLKPAAAKKLKSVFIKLDTEASKLDSKLKEQLLALPNFLDEEVPAGDESNNVQITLSGEVRRFDVKAVDHLELGKKLKMLDFERGAKTSGARFYYITGDLARLSRALQTYVLDRAVDKGYVFMQTPHIVSEKIIWGKGLLTQDEIDLNVYKIHDGDKYLIGTGEIPLTAYHADEVLELDSLPLKYCTITPCYRKEAGTYGKHAKGLFRVHQFEKLEIYQYTTESQSEIALDEMVQFEQDVLGKLEIPYRTVLVAAGDMAGYLYKQYDLEYMSPVDNTYRELMSAGNARDFQTRRLNIRYKDADGKLQFAHTLNATAAATSRLLIAIMENFQTYDGQIIIPKVLQPYMRGQAIIG